MDFDIILTIVGFVLSALGFWVSLRQLKQGKKSTAIIGIVLLIACTTGLLGYRMYHHNRQIGQVKNEIIELLTEDSLTLDELHENLLFRSFPEVTESLFLLVEERAVRHRLTRITTKRGLLSVRRYYRPYSQGGRGEAPTSPGDEEHK